MKRLSMESIISILIILTFFTTTVRPQERDSLIQLYPGLGDTIDQFDRNYFELFPNVNDYQFAVFYIRNNDELVSKVNYSQNSFLKDTIFIQNVKLLEEARIKIGKIEEESNKKFNSTKKFTIITNDNNEYKCKLEMFSKHSLYLLSDMDLFTGKTDEFRFKILLSDIKSINVLGGSKVFPTAGWGFLIGGITNLAVALVFLSQSGDNSTAGTFGAAFAGGGIIGGVIGLIVGLFLERDYSTIQIESKDDLLKFKDYAKYYFKYNESIEKDYIELK